METSKSKNRSHTGERAEHHARMGVASARPRDILPGNLLFRDLRQTIDLPRHLKSNPYGTLAAVVGLGYVLGGGLFSSTTRRLLGLGLRIGLRVGALALAGQQLTLLVDGSDGVKSLLNPQPQEGASR